MILSPSRPLPGRPHLLALASLLFTACTGSLELPPPPTAEEIPALEAAVEAHPDDLDTGILLASAYRAAGRISDARTLVGHLRESAPEHVGLLILDGLLRESDGDLAGAREAYSAALETDPGGEVSNELERRLDVLREEELKREVRDALAREEELDANPDPATVGVFPFAYAGSDPQWEPLRLAMAELLITDLAITGRIRVLERVKVQALLDEIALAESGRVEAATAARGGRILGSGRIVQGRFDVTDENRLLVDAAVLEVRAEDVDLSPITAEDDIERLFDLEKRLALDVHAALGVQLTPAERARVNERQTESVQALLAFGRGLASSDRGEWETAEQHFAEAAQFDPSFGLAAQRREVSSSRAPSAPERLRSRAALQARRRQAVQALRNAPASARAALLQRMAQRQRAVLAEVLGQDRLGNQILLELVFRLPGGSP